MPPCKFLIFWFVGNVNILHFLWESFLCPPMVRISETILFSSKLLKKQNTGICHFCQKYCNNLLTGLWASSAFFLQFTPTIATELRVCFSLIRTTVITPTHLSTPALNCFLVGKSTWPPNDGSNSWVLASWFFHSAFTWF